MDLKSGYPFWAVKNGLLAAFPQLTRDHESEVVIIGGGITGALIAEELSRHGHHVVVLERRDIGWGSSAASTALLQLYMRATQEGFLLVGSDDEDLPERREAMV